MKTVVPRFNLSGGGAQYFSAFKLKELPDRSSFAPPTFSIVHFHQQIGRPAYAADSISRYPKPSECVQQPAQFIRPVFIQDPEVGGGRRATRHSNQAPNNIQILPVFLLRVDTSPDQILRHVSHVF